MRPLADSTKQAAVEAALIAELCRLEGEIREFRRELDRIEYEMWQAFNESPVSALRTTAEPE